METLPKEDRSATRDKWAQEAWMKVYQSTGDKYLIWNQREVHLIAPYCFWIFLFFFQSLSYHSCHITD